MVQINFSLKEVNCKIVYYGPGLSGKTTNLEVVHKKAPPSSVGELTSIATEGDRTLFFDFLPLNLGQVAGMKTRFQIYTVPGQVYYNSTRKLVLQGADGVVFVADSKRGKMPENIESLANLEENLIEFGLDIDNLSIVLQFNKRDLPDVYTCDEMNEALNRWNAPYFEAVARAGEGVFPTLKHLAGMVLESLNRQHGSSAIRAGSVAARKPAPVAAGARASARGTPQATPLAASQDKPASQARAVSQRRPVERSSVPRAAVPSRPVQSARVAAGAARTHARGRPTLFLSTPTPRRKARPRNRIRRFLFLVLLGIAGATALHFTGLLKFLL